MQSLLVLGVSLVLSIVIAMGAIPMFRRLKFGQTVREDGPQNHNVKNGTPTIGGLIFVLSIVLTSIIFLDKTLVSVYPIMALVLLSLIGFVDDFLKIIRKKNLGLTALQKIILMLIVSFFLGVMAKEVYGTEIMVPFTSFNIDLGWMFVPFIMLVYIGASNAVNLTDGLDGLATSVTIVVLIFMGVIAAKVGNFTTADTVIISIGALIGFLLFNRNPAKIFMGDTGSLGLGGLIVGLSLQLKMPLILLIIGIVYIIETLSVIIQVISFKTRGKRIFKMSPIHHHFELEGYSENVIVMIFSFVSLVFGMVALLAI